MYRIIILLLMLCNVVFANTDNHSGNIKSSYFALKHSCEKAKQYGWDKGASPQYLREALEKQGISYSAKRRQRIYEATQEFEAKCIIIKFQSYDFERHIHKEATRKARKLRFGNKELARYLGLRTLYISQGLKASRIVKQDLILRNVYNKDPQR